MRNIETENLQEIIEELTVPSSKLTASKQGIHTCHREYLTPLAKISYLNHGVHYRRGSEVIHAKTKMMEQKMSQFLRDL
ncbi:hypothetical protein J1N35_033802 [Gossypium stocksii]|uniref:Uncharacterized protein n=1 Tax=Gossypium stocksii TaxID=47602 RepID=A0A9D3UQW3_9ROSI|nr:hypothetical protein J1N35_033802 [Gossypium stocksii]